jgi:hypothetical protein
MTKCASMRSLLNPAAAHSPGGRLAAVESLVDLTDDRRLSLVPEAVLMREDDRLGA